ncbi:MAG: threonylcarbamoyl-AMP synthase [marine bacterium B5-7]|nr:MAG: threonylcarbamoyl-AMP synthase [marine bacterium B5-7]
MHTHQTTDAHEAAAILRRGGLVAFPTETVYGLGAVYNDADAVAKVFAAKGRPADNPLIVHIHSVAQLHTLVDHIPPHAQALIDAFWPGPLTLVLPKHADIPDFVTTGLPSIAIRCPDHPQAQTLLKACDIPLVAPSANRSGSPSPTQAQHVLEDLDGRIEAVFTGPATPLGLESTVVDCTVTPANLLRPGMITLSPLQSVLPDIQCQSNSATQPKSPGQKYAHYAPKARVCLIDTVAQLPEDKNIAYIGLDQPTKTLAKMLLATDLHTYAQALYAFFRECDSQSISTIYAQTVPPQGLGLALMNRLQKAAK